MNYSNTCDVIIVINGSRRRAPSHQVSSEMNISCRTNVSLSTPLLPFTPPLKSTNPECIMGYESGSDINFSPLTGVKIKYP